MPRKRPFERDLYLASYLSHERGGSSPLKLLEELETILLPTLLALAMHSSLIKPTIY